MGWFAAGIVAALVGATAALATPPDGGVLYRTHCAGCHGDRGRGDGPDAALFVAPPRDLAEVLDRYDAATLVRRVRDGAALPLLLDRRALGTRLTEVEEVVTFLHALPAIDWRRVEPGEELWIDRCELCHGAFGRPPATLPPGVGPPPDLSAPAVQRALDDEALVRIVRHGHRGMPAIPPLRGEPEARALAAFVRVLSPGYELYTRHCAACHGEDGRPQSDFAEPLRRPPVVFDRAYLARRDPEALRAAVWHMLAEQKPAMPHFRDVLDAAEARAIVEYLRRRRASG
jgi:mono/diheme cytochrome c family protein